MPLAVETWGLTKAEIDKGVDGPFVAAVHFEFDSLDVPGAAMAAAGHGGGLMADVANYTEHHAGPADERDHPERLSGPLARLSPSSLSGRRRTASP